MAEAVKTRAERALISLRQRILSGALSGGTRLFEVAVAEGMPGLWMDDWGMEITETIRITEDGPPECFCDRPRELFVKD